ncbi:MAG: SDR family oxidoreductase, partial [Actinomycetota bacterium]|nr:SDR family oxidoreductase [Actinomycetota bacterium]
PGQSNYGAAKSGIASFGVIVAKELGRYGVTVNAIAPGARTRMTLSVPRPGAAAPAEVAADEFDRRDPANVAPLVVWLGSPGSADVTGQTFNVAGGMIGVAEGWRRGPSEDKGDRWTPSEVGDVVPKLLGSP